MRTMKHIALAAMAATALALAGCGGGGGGNAGGPATPVDPMPPAPTPVSVTLPSDGNMYLDAAQTTLEDGTVSLEAGASTTLGAYMLSCSDAGPCEITIADGAVEATGEVTADYTAAAQAAIDAAMKVAAAERKDRATGLSSALADSTAARGVAIRPTGATGKKNDDLTITRGLSGGAMVTEGRLGGKAGWMAGDAAMSVSGWTGKTLSSGTKSFTVYTDIVAAKRKSFQKEYPLGSDNSSNSLTGELAGITVQPAQPDSDPPVAYRLALTTAGMQNAGHAGLLDPTKFPQPKDAGKGDNKFEYFGSVGKKATSFKGTFHGASGTYKCDSNDCVVSVTARNTAVEPAYTVSGSGWTFTPDTNNNPQVIDQDADHMHFGWWIDDPKAAGVGGEFLYDAQVFFGGSMALVTTATIQELQGDATYEGPAAGLYAVTADAANDVAAAYGEFTATATLTAKFGNASATGTLGGKIASFKRDDGVANDWSLALSSTTIGDTGAGIGLIADGVDQIGGWHFQLYGSGKDRANPTGIAGAFDAAIDKNTKVAGGFGTKPQ